MKLSHTRETGLTLAHFKGVTVGTKPHRPACWQHISGEGSPTGPQYPTRAEALADTRAFAERTCGYVDPTLAAKGEILDADGCYPDGYNASGLDRWGYDVEGYDEQGYTRDGYKRDGHDARVFDRQGFDYFGFDRDASTDSASTVSASTGTATPMNRAAHDAKVDLLRIDFNLACRAHAESLQAISDAERVLVETRQVMHIMREAYYAASTARDDFLKGQDNG